jgi:hypothetical protein
MLADALARFCVLRNALLDSRLQRMLEPGRAHWFELMRQQVL